MQRNLNWKKKSQGIFFNVNFMDEKKFFNFITEIKQQG